MDATAWLLVAVAALILERVLSGYVRPWLRREKAAGVEFQKTIRDATDKHGNRLVFIRIDTGQGEGFLYQDYEEPERWRQAVAFAIREADRWLHDYATKVGASMKEGPQ